MKAWLSLAGVAALCVANIGSIPAAAAQDQPQACGWLDQPACTDDVFTPGTQSTTGGGEGLQPFLPAIYCGTGDLLVDPAGICRMTNARLLYGPATPLAMGKYKPDQNCGVGTARSCFDVLDNDQLKLDYNLDHMGCPLYANCLITLGVLTAVPPGRYIYAMPADANGQPTGKVILRRNENPSVPAGSTACPGFEAFRTPWNSRSDPARPYAYVRHPQLTGGYMVGSDKKLTAYGVFAAGELVIDATGALQQVDNSSGHFQPAFATVVNLKKEFMARGIRLASDYREIDSSGGQQVFESPCAPVVMSPVLQINVSGGDNPVTLNLSGDVEWIGVGSSVQIPVYSNAVTLYARPRTPTSGLTAQFTMTYVGQTAPLTTATITVPPLLETMKDGQYATASTVSTSPVGFCNGQKWFPTSSLRPFPANDYPLRLNSHINLNDGAAAPC